MKAIIELFLTFFKIGLFTFGGGYAMISIIEDECVERKKWITHDDMMNVTVIAESTPGPIAVNCATFVGYKQAGLLGAACATAGVVLPSFAIIYAIALFFDNFLTIPLIANAFKGIKVGVGVLIISAAVKMITQMFVKNEKENADIESEDIKSAEKFGTSNRFNIKIFNICILVLAFVAMMLINLFSIKISSIVLMLVAGIIGLAFGMLQEVRK